MQNFRYLKENPSNPYRLGRHQVLDALEPENDARHLVREWFRPLRTVHHREYLPVFDQGQLGSCTANAALGCLVTAPFGHKGVSFTEDDAVALYEAETKLDDSQIPGEYPPNDTGSTGVWSMKALEKQGLIRSHVHTRGLHVALHLLSAGPISAGVTWYSSMFDPDSDATIHVDTSSGIAGGHQVCIVANDVQMQRVRIRNSWGESWGDDGHAWLSWSELDFLLHEGGDVVQPIL